LESAIFVARLLIILDRIRGIEREQSSWTGDCCGMIEDG
jgi:hypothetical protein